jgi:surfactin synthase thioesterase subunit
MSQWWYRPKVAATPRLRLFCFPYAGGWPSVYRSWAERLPADIELVAIRTPGRESRFAESPYTDWRALATDTAQALGPLFDAPFVFFGHSFGGMLAYEVASVLRDREKAMMRTLIVSGCRNPSVRPQTRAPFDAPSNALWAWLADIDGTPAEVLENQQLRALAEPSLRADLKLADTWTSVAPVVERPIVTFGGSDDRIVSRGQIEGWRNFTAGAYRHVQFAGGHFFIHSLEAQVVAEVSSICRAA